MKKVKSKNYTTINTPYIIGGQWVSDKELSEFLDWSFVTKMTDYKTFKELKESGFFVKNPITSEMLQEACERG